MRYLVVKEQSDLEAVADSVLKARLGRKARATALAAIRDANPGLNFSRLRSGGIVRIPAIDALKDGAVGGLDALDEILGAATDALKRLATDTTAANEANDEERKETRRLLESEVGELRGQFPELEERAEAVLRAYEEDSNDERERTRQLVDDVDDWTRQLEKLRDL